jgi:hypothetical protein
LATTVTAFGRARRAMALVLRRTTTIREAPALVAIDDLTVIAAGAAWAVSASATAVAARMRMVRGTSRPF